MSIPNRRILLSYFLSVVSCALICTGCANRVATDPAPDIEVAKKLRTTLEEAGGGAIASVQVAAEVQPTGFATLKGRFILTGSPPANPANNITRDLDMCGGSSIDAQLVVSDEGGIKNILIYAEQIPEAWVHESAQGKTDDFIFDQKDCVFLTRVAAFQLSQPMKIMNSDPRGHNTDFEPRYSGSFNQTIPGDGGFAVYQAEEEEKDPVSVKCAIHPWMQAWVLPRKNAYFAVTDDEGNFEIPSLPAGVDVSLRAWHERTRGIQNVTLNGEKKKWSKGKFKKLLEADQVLDLQVTIDAAEFE